MNLARMLPALVFLFVLSPADAAPLEIGGRVLSDGGAPIGGASIQINGAETTTDETGRFTAVI